MQYEAQILKSSDQTKESKTNDALSVSNQELATLNSTTNKETTAAATAQLESSGTLPAISLDGATNSATDSAGSAASDTGTTSNNDTTRASTSDSTPTTTSDSAATSSSTALALEQLNSVIDRLNNDEQTLAKDPKSAPDLSNVNADETALSTDERGYRKDSVAAGGPFSEYEHVLLELRPKTKAIADGLYDMGQKKDAGETTAYYPISQYEKYFSKTGGASPTDPTDPTEPTDPTSPTEPTDPTSPTLKDETSYTNMQSDTWNKNLIASEIGGEGKDPNMQLSDSDGKMTATMSGGAYTDGLISNTQKLNTDDNTVQMNYNESIKPGSDLHALENDIAITTGKQSDGKTLTAMAASQFVMNSNGTMDFDTSGMNHQWVDAVNNIPIPKDGDLDVSMTVKMDGDKYEYTGLTVDGKTYAISPSDADFTMTTIGPKGWTPDSIHTQLQQDLGSAGGSSTVTYNDVQINQGDS